MSATGSTIKVPHPSSEIVAVGIAQCQVTRDPQALLVSYGLGSCVGVAAWDPVAHVGGLIHILLPEPMQEIAVVTATKFASTGIPVFLKLLQEQGAQLRRLHVVAAGGAQMLSALAKAGPLKGIGTRNCEVVTETLANNGIVLAQTDFGGSVGRTLCLVVSTGECWVRIAGGQQRPL